MPTVIKIEPPQFQNPAKIRCAAYCRVSSGSEDQLNSYAAQITYYSSRFRDSETEVLVGIYAYEGITGTSQEKRTEFQRLMSDCLEGKIDKIFTKSISRFARNTKDCLTCIRMLKTFRVTVYFEKENIETSTLSDEMMNDMAKLCADHGIRIGRTRLFRWLRSKGILMEGNIPYQVFIERGYFKVKESVFDYCGEPKTYQQTMVTGRGQLYILARLMREYGTEVPNA